MLFNILFTYPKSENQKFGSLKRPRVLVVKQYSSLLQYMLFHAASDINWFLRLMSHTVR